MKDKLRKEISTMRNNLSEVDVLEKSNLIGKRLFDMIEFKQVHTILFYVSYGNEVYTHEMIKKCLLSGKQVVVPKSNTNNSTLLLSELKNWDDLELGAYNILEPKEKSIKEVAIESIDLIIVPGVGFDENGNRIGHGKGYYDKLLRNSNKTVNIGLSFECQIIEKIPTGKYDIPVDIIVTEKRVIYNQ